MKKRHINKIREFIRKTPVFSVSSILKLVGNKNYTYVIINHLLKKGEIKRLTKGFYTVLEEPSIAVYCFKPAYLGLQDAMSFHNLWEQETIPIIILRKDYNNQSKNNLLLQNK